MAKKSHSKIPNIVRFNCLEEESKPNFPEQKGIPSITNNIDALELEESVIANLSASFKGF